MGEGSDDRLEPGNSFLFANLEMVMCVLLRRFPEISPTDHPRTPISSYASTGEPLSAVSTAFLSEPVFFVRCLTVENSLDLQ